jgi:hypothetical protein
MTAVRRTVAVVLACSAAVACGSAAGRRTDSSDPVRRYLLVSGRDDHGLLELATVPLASHPGFHEHSGAGHDQAAAQVADGTIVRVVAVRADWHLVETLSGPPARGWVDDYRLRGTARLVGAAPRCAVRVGQVVASPGEPVELLGVDGEDVEVRLERDPSVRGLVQSRYVRELPPSSTDPCARTVTDQVRSGRT